MDNLGAMLSEHFSGVSVLLPLLGYGLRDPNDPTSLEINRNLPFLVYPNPTPPRIVTLIDSSKNSAMHLIRASSSSSGRRHFCLRPIVADSKLAGESAPFFIK